MAAVFDYLCNADTIYAYSIDFLRKTPASPETLFADLLPGSPQLPFPSQAHPVFSFLVFLKAIVKNLSPYSLNSLYKSAFVKGTWVFSMGINRLPKNGCR